MEQNYVSFIFSQIYESLINLNIPIPLRTDHVVTVNAFWLMTTIAIFAIAVMSIKIYLSVKERYE